MYNVYHEEVKKAETDLKTHVVTGVSKGKTHNFSVEMQGSNTERVSILVPTDADDPVQSIKNLDDGIVEILFKLCPRATSNRAALSSGRTLNTTNRKLLVDKLQPETLVDGDFYCMENDNVTHGPYYHQFTTMPFNKTIKPTITRAIAKYDGTVELTIIGEKNTGYYNSAEIEIYLGYELLGKLNSSSGKQIFSTTKLPLDKKHLVSVRYHCPDIHKHSDYFDFEVALTSEYPPVTGVTGSNKTFDGATINWVEPTTILGVKPTGYQIFIGAKLYAIVHIPSVRITGMDVELLNFDMRIVPDYNGMIGDSEQARILKYSSIDANAEVYTPEPNAFEFKFNHPMEYEDKVVITLNDGTPKYITKDSLTAVFLDLPWDTEFLVKVVVLLESGVSFTVHEYFMKTPPQ